MIPHLSADDGVGGWGGVKSTFTLLIRSFIGEIIKKTKPTVRSRRVACSPDPTPINGRDLISSLRLFVWNRAICIQTYSQFPVGTVGVQ